MMNMFLNTLKRLHKEEEGQGLVEYVLIIALVAFAAVAGMSTLASSINSAFTKVGSILGTYVT
jgi:pilus assembly protein Flp/PilA